MAEALALPARSTILVELAYPRDAVHGHRFPTVADAELTHQFRPAREVAPDATKKGTLTGWTKPTGSWPKQPEVAHENAPLSVLSRAPRFVGRIP